MGLECASRVGHWATGDFSIGHRAKGLVDREERVGLGPMPDSEVFPRPVAHCPIGERSERAEKSLRTKRQASTPQVRNVGSGSEIEACRAKGYGPGVRFAS